MIVGAAVAALVTSAAPVVIVTGLVAGAVVQSGFNAWGLSDDVGTFAQTTFFGR
jgi:hypothetical protein